MWSRQMWTSEMVIQHQHLFFCHNNNNKRNIAHCQGSFFCASSDSVRIELYSGGVANIDQQQQQQRGSSRPLDCWTRAGRRECPKSIATPNRGADRELKYWHATRSTASAHKSIPVLYLSSHSLVKQGRGSFVCGVLWCASDWVCAQTVWIRFRPVPTRAVLLPLRPQALSWIIHRRRLLLLFPGVDLNLNGLPSILPHTWAPSSRCSTWAGVRLVIHNIRDVSRAFRTVLHPPGN